LMPLIKKIIPHYIKIIDSGEAVARQTKNILTEKVGFRTEDSPSTQLFYTNLNPVVLSSILKNKYHIITNDF